MYHIGIRGFTSGLRRLYSQCICSQRSLNPFLNVVHSHGRKAGSGKSWQGAAWPVTVSRYLSTGTDDEAEPVIEYRMSTTDDYEGIMSIGRNLFEGLDYLPGTYKALSNDPSWSGICVLHEGQIVGFSGGHVVNGGTAMMLRGGRLTDNLRRQGILYGMMKFALSTFVAKKPTLVDFYSTFKSNSFFLQTVMYSDPKNQVFQRSCVAHKFVSPSSPRPSPDSNIAVQAVDKDAMASIFNDPQNSQRLFVDGFINPRYVFMTPTVDNIDLIYRIADQRLATVKSGGECTVLSLGVHFPCSAGYAYHIECYGSSEREDLSPHIHAHLTAAYDAIAASNNPEADLYVFTYGRKGDYDFSWLDEVLNARGAVRYELKYDHYVGLRNKASDVPY